MALKSGLYSNPSPITGHSPTLEDSLTTWILNISTYKVEAKTHATYIHPLPRVNEASLALHGTQETLKE